LFGPDAVDACRAFVGFHLEVGGLQVSGFEDFFH
jgi:hypothetical protein